MLPWDAGAAAGAPGGPCWFPRPFQGTGRHDNPGRYGCLYLAEAPEAAVAEALAPFRGSGELEPGMLVRAGRPLALAALEVADGPPLIDLDEPRVLAAETLRPSEVATRARAVTQAYAARLFDEHPDAVGLRWWSTLEAAWINVTLWDRPAARPTALGTTELTVTHPQALRAAELLGLG